MPTKAVSDAVWSQSQHEILVKSSSPKRCVKSVRGIRHKKDVKDFFQADSGCEEEDIPWHRNLSLSSNALCRMIVDAKLIRMLFIFSFAFSCGELLFQ